MYQESNHMGMTEISISFYQYSCITWASPIPVKSRVTFND